MASDCVRPIGDALYQVMFARGDFVQSTVIEIETSHTEAVTEMLVHMATVGVHIDADENWLASDRVHFDGTRRR